MLTIDIDIGGTFTDCLVASEGKFVWSKVPTTTYNLSVGFKEAIEQAGSQLGLSLEELLSETAVIRYSTTLAMNTLLQRAGPKLGLITTAGFEHLILIGRSRQWADGLHPKEWRHIYKWSKPEPLIPYDMTVGIRERIDCFGRIVIPIDKEDVRQKIEYLVDRGARGFVISLLWSFMNPVHERMVKEMIEEEYGEPYLGNMPVLCSSEVQPKWHEYPRTNVTILSAYLQTEFTESLSGLAEELRDRGYTKPLHIINNRGGMAKVSRTRAVDTFGAGPVAGLMASAYYAKLYEWPRVVATDMGGTSFDYGIVERGEVRSYEEWPVIDRWATEGSMLEVKSIGAGGGSLAWLNPAIGNALDVGPWSAGANPGPACYNLGGTEPTVTDADVVLSFINPDYFLGGKLKLNKALAVKSMERVGKPLGMSPAETALAIRKVIDGKMGSTLFYELSMRGLEPSQFILFAYGGAGPAHCVGYNSHLGARQIVTFPYAAVFCALGGTTMNVKYTYELSRHLCLYSPEYPKGFLEDFERWNEAIRNLQGQAFRDLRGEGFRPEEAVFALELDMRYGRALYITRCLSPRLFLESLSDVEAVCQAFYNTFTAKYTKLAATPQVGVNVENFCLHAMVPIPGVSLPSFEMGGEDPSPAYKGRRQVYWELDRSIEETLIFDAERLRAGNVVVGPAIIEAKDTTVVIPPGWKYSLDRYLTGILQSF